MSNSVKIQTAQNVELEYPVANVGLRILAYIIDFMCLVVYLIIMGSVIGKITDTVGIDNTKIALGFIFFTPLVFYSFLFEKFGNGQTLGKKALNIRVVSKDGSNLTTGQLLIRWLFRVIDIHISYGIVALLTVAIGNKGQRLGDMVGNTCVIHLEREKNVRRTAFQSVNENYIPTYPEVKSLKPSDISTIKEILSNRSDNYYELLTETSAHLENTLEIKKGGNSREFLSILIKDYNYYMALEAQQEENKEEY